MIWKGEIDPRPHDQFDMDNCIKYNNVWSWGNKFENYMELESDSAAGTFIFQIFNF